MNKLFVTIWILSFINFGENTITICPPIDFNADTELNLSELLNLLVTDLTEIAKYLSDNEGHISIEHIDLDLKHPAISIKGPLDGLDVYNLLDFKICFFQNVNVNASTFDLFHLTFSNISLHAKNYDLSGDFGDIFDLYGNGKFVIELYNLSVALTDFTLNVVGDDLCMPINVNLTIGAMMTEFENFLDDVELTDLFNDLIKTIGPEAIDIIWGEIKDIFDKPLEEVFQLSIR